ncbi:MAG: hypothetical protein HY247_05260 [archaeon]|nr:MAG: hypothetical protein HY247_05260 [archaeon]
MLEKLTGSAGASILAQIGWVVFLVGTTLLAAATGDLDQYTASSLVVAIVFVVTAWFSFKGKPWAFLASAVLGILFLVATGYTFSSGVTERSLIVWAASLGSTLLVLMTIGGVLAYAESKKGA